MLTLRAARTNRPDEYSWLPPGRGTGGLAELGPVGPGRHAAQPGQGRQQGPGHGQQRADRPDGDRRPQPQQLAQNAAWRRWPARSDRCSREAASRPRSRRP
jgi:hypothetical protein